MNICTKLWHHKQAIIYCRRKPGDCFCIVRKYKYHTDVNKSVGNVCCCVYVRNVFLAKYFDVHFVNIARTSSDVIIEPMCPCFPDFFQKALVQGQRCRMLRYNHSTVRSYIHYTSQQGYFGLGRIVLAKWYKRTWSFILSWKTRIAPESRIYGTNPYISCCEKNKTWSIWLTNIYSLLQFIVWKNSNSIGNSFSCKSITVYQLAINFSTCHNSIAGVPHENVCMLLQSLC